MSECKICGEDLYKNILFYNMFKLNYIYHNDCLNKLNYNYEEEIIPIEGNIIIYDYTFEDLPDKYNNEYLEFSNLINLMIKQVKNNRWSMMILYDEEVELFFNKFNPYLVINLTKRPILLISLVKKKIEVFEEL